MSLFYVRICLGIVCATAMLSMAGLAHSNRLALVGLVVILAAGLLPLLWPISPQRWELDWDLLRNLRSN